MRTECVLIHNLLNKNTSLRLNGRAFTSLTDRRNILMNVFKMGKMLGKNVRRVSEKARERVHIFHLVICISIRVAIKYNVCHVYAW